MSVSVQCSPLSSFVLLQSSVSLKSFSGLLKDCSTCSVSLFFKCLSFDCTGSSSLFKGFSLVVVRGLLIAVTSLVAEHGL